VRELCCAEEGPHRLTQGVGSAALGHDFGPVVAGEAFVEGVTGGRKGDGIPTSRTVKVTMIGNHVVVYVSYLPPRRQFTAHREGLPGISASSLPELRARVAEACPEAKVVLSLSRAARTEVARRRGAPVQLGWT
jgi:hypothetical protein